MKRKRERERARGRERERGEGRYFDLLRFGPGSVESDVGGQVDFVQLVVHELPQVPRQVVVSKRKQILNLSSFFGMSVFISIPLCYC